MSRYKETFDTWNKVAKQYESKFMDLDLYNHTYDFFCNSIPRQKAKILDMGCGPGNITKYILSKRPDLDIYGIDVAPNMIALAKKNNPDAKFDTMDIRDVVQIKTNYDGIICGFCIPYLSKSACDQLIVNCSKLLNENGLLYLSFVEGNPSKSDFQIGKDGNSVYFYFHNLDYLRKKLIENKFVELNKFEVAYKKSDSEIEMHTILIATLAIEK